MPMFSGAIPDFRKFAKPQDPGDQPVDPGLSPDDSVQQYADQPVAAGRVDPTAEMRQPLPADHAVPDFRSYSKFANDTMRGTTPVGSGMKPESGPNDGPKSRDQSGADKHDVETKKISDLLNELDAAQQDDMHKARMSRMSEWFARGGEAFSSGIGGLPMTSVSTQPLTPLPSKAAAVGQRIKLGEEMKQDLFKRENPELERQNHLVIETNHDSTKLTAEQQREAAAKLLKDYEEAQSNDRLGKRLGVTQSEGDKNRAAGLVRPVIAANAAAGQTGAKADAGAANDQATRQIPGWEQIKPNSAQDHTKATDNASANNTMQTVGTKMIGAMRKNGRNFPASTEWKNLSGDYMLLNQALNHLNHNGVMNFKDKENNDVQIGNAQDFVQYVQNNGPDVLEHQLGSLQNKTVAENEAMGYKPWDAKKGSWAPKGASGYLGGMSSGGGSSQSGPVQDPNVVNDVIDSVNKGKKMPAFKSSPSSKAPDASGDLKFDETKVVGGKKYGKRGDDWYSVE